jgi:hypothetical protein
MKCLNEYGECGWDGDVDECQTLNGNEICPKCGSSVEDDESNSYVHPIFEEILNGLTRGITR